MSHPGNVASLMISNERRLPDGSQSRISDDTGSRPLLKKSSVLSIRGERKKIGTVFIYFPPVSCLLSLLAEMGVLRNKLRCVDPRNVYTIRKKFAFLFPDQSHPAALSSNKTSVSDCLPV